MELSLAKRANQIEHEIIKSRGEKLYAKHGPEAGKVIRAMAVSGAKKELAKQEQPTEEQPAEEMNENKLREMVRAALSKPLNEKASFTKKYDEEFTDKRKDLPDPLQKAILKKQDKLEESEEEINRYMFFSNLQQIRRQADILLGMDQNMIERILDNGHDWAQDHIAEAKSFLDQVFDFFMNETKKTTETPTVTVVDLDKVDEAKKMTSSKAMSKLKEAVLAKLKNK